MRISFFVRLSFGRLNSLLLEDKEGSGDFDREVRGGPPRFVVDNRLIVGSREMWCPI
jgi:hypothetical protein